MLQIMNEIIKSGNLSIDYNIEKAYNPWNPYQNKTINNIEQANCFESYKIEFENQQWLLGFSIFSIGERNNDKHYHQSEQSASLI